MEGNAGRRLKLVGGQLCAVYSILCILIIHLFISSDPLSLSAYTSANLLSARERLDLLGLHRAARDCRQTFRDSNVLSNFFKSHESTNLLLDARSKNMVNGWIQKNGGERKVNAVFEELLFPQCSNDVIFLDIGANVGYYGIKARRYGCISYLFDPQPGCIEIIEANICLNFPRDDGISSVPFGLAKQGREILVPSVGCSGTYSLAHDIYEKKKAKEDVSSKLLDLEILKQVPKMSLIVKIDTEGNEVDLLDGMLDLVRQSKVKDIIVEVTPKFWDSMGLPRQSAVNILTQYLQHCMIYEPKHYGKASFVALTESTLQRLLTDPALIQTDLWISCFE